MTDALERTRRMLAEAKYGPRSYPLTSSEPPRFEWAVAVDVWQSLRDRVGWADANFSGQTLLWGYPIAVDHALDPGAIVLDELSGTPSGTRHALNRSRLGTVEATSERG